MFDTVLPVLPSRSRVGLNAQQQAAVDHRGSPLLIVAGAGTGKTRTLTARVAALIDGGADPARVLLLTFTRRAAAEMLGRVSAATNSRASQVWGGTFHSVANRLLRTYARAAGIGTGFTVLDQADSTDLFAMARTEAGFGERAKRFPRAQTVASIYSRMVNSQAKLQDVLDTDYPWCSEHTDDLRTVFTSYSATKRSNGVLDYDDLLLFWRGLTASAIGPSLRNMFDHVLIDEYQDTNPIQADIVRGMCGPDTDLCAVGDDAQAIYGFRAATVANMWDFGQHFPGARTITLEQNYRSTMAVLAVGNAVLNQPEPYAQVHHAKQLWSDRPTGPKPVLATHHDEGAQARAVATAILDARERGIDLRRQAVLFRAGHHSAGLELELTRRDIPFVKYGGLAYLETAHVKDLLALLRILDNPTDQLAWHRVLSMLEGVGPATVRRLNRALGIDQHSPNALRSFVDGAGVVPPAAREQAEELRAAMADCVGLTSGEGTAEPAPAMQVERFAPFCELVFAARYDNAEARLGDISQLAATAAAYQTRSRFLTELTLDPPGRTSDLAGPPTRDDDWLTLSTIHSAKGLEWSAVHVLHAADGNIPSDMAISANRDDPAGLAEELRLLYVALTRAADELSVHMPLRFHVNRFAADDRHVYGQLSRFLEPVRELFDETTSGPDLTDSEVLDLTPVAIADEVDTALAALWD